MTLKKNCRKDFIAMKIEYTKHGDYYLPNLVNTADTKNLKLGKYGKMRLRFLQQHKKDEYTILWMNNELKQHLLDTDKIANERFELLIRLLEEKENITEKLKAQDQLKWVGLMNNIKNSAEEIILKEIIYV